MDPELITDLMDPKSIRIKSIAQMSSQYDVTLRTLRFYEDKGLLRPIRQGLSRYYTPNDEIRLQLILKGKSLGFSLIEIRNLISDKSKSPVLDDPIMASYLSIEIVVSRIKELEIQRNRIDEALTDLYLAKKTLSSA